MLETELGHIVLGDKLSHRGLVEVAVLAADVPEAVQVRPHVALAEPGVLHVRELVVAVRIVFVNRVPKSGIPSVSGYAMTMTLPSWISAAAALVTAGVTRLVAPVWSFGPQGEGGTTVLQSVWANTAGADAIRDASTAITTNRDLRLMRRTPFDGEGHGTSGAVTRGY